MRHSVTSVAPNSSATQWDATRSRNRIWKRRVKPSSEKCSALLALNLCINVKIYSGKCTANSRSRCLNFILASCEFKHQKLGLNRTNIIHSHKSKSKLSISTTTTTQIHPSSQAQSTIAKNTLTNQPNYQKQSHCYKAAGGAEKGKNMWQKAKKCPKVLWCGRTKFYITFRAPIS